MKSLVLGGSAFIGRRLVEVLQAAGHTVTVLNRGSRNDGIDGAGGVECLVADRSDPASVRDALGSAEFDAVFDVRADGGRALVAVDTRGASAVTLLDALAPDTATSRSYYGLLFEDLR